MTHSRLHNNSVADPSRHFMSLESQCLEQ